ncbi:MAG TPA: GntR family transcriptional regulator [Steroidobacteraceae bacterium]|nr:GntR family transcriptional regulator [Steroidobacteraceae bacterium]
MAHLTESSARRKRAPGGAQELPSARAAARSARAAKNGIDTAEVHERIWSAIVDHSLPPETRLVESELCEIFGIGRTRMRQVLQQLAHERVVTLMRNRGAMVSKPSVREAREVFAARRLIEAGIVETHLKSATPKDVKRLQEHVAREEEAWRGNDRRAILKLSGEFHLLLAEAAGNSILLEMLRDLVSRSSLIIAVYQPPGASPCPPDAHRELTAMLERRERSAIRLMIQHLNHVFADLMLEDRNGGGIDLKTVFGAWQ